MKKFKNNLGVESNNIHLLKAFAEEATQAGWNHQKLADKDNPTRLYFRGHDSSTCILSKGSFRFVNNTLNKSPDSKYFNLPEQWNEAIEYMKEEIQESKKAGVKVGQRFISSNFYSQKYILSRMIIKGQAYCSLTNLEDGNMFRHAVPVENSHNLTEEDWKAITGGTMFILVD